MKMTSMHTPGPWEREREGLGRNIVGGGLLVAQTVGDSAEAEANGDLIAAAPELLEAARTVLVGLNERIDRAIEEGSGSVPVFAGIAALSDAIAKAEGAQ